MSIKLERCGLNPGINLKIRLGMVRPNSTWPFNPIEMAFTLPICCAKIRDFSDFD